MTPLERAVKALGDTYDVSKRGEITNLEDCARAVLTAIREPSRVMLDAAGPRLKSEGTWGLNSENDRRREYAAMIGAAMQEEPPPPIRRNRFL